LLTIGYGHTNGHKTTPDQLNAIFNGLWTNGLVNYDRVLTGYIPGEEALQVVEEQIKRMRQNNPELVYVLDRTSIVKMLLTFQL
jgi:pyridoxine kinase